MLAVFSGLASLCLLQGTPATTAFSGPHVSRAGKGSILQKQARDSRTRLFSDWEDDSLDSNKWKSSNDVYEEQEDWQDVLGKKQDGSFWTAFESSDDDSELPNGVSGEEREIDESEAWLDTLASLQAEEVTFNMKEADRADKARRHPATAAFAGMTMTVELHLLLLF